MMLAEQREPQTAQRGEMMLVVAIASLLSVAAFAFFFSRGDILLYGDAVAHLNIARRFTDSRQAGFDQLGTVWLPLPHLLVAPFVAFSGLWQSGVGGSLPSMVAYVLGVAGIYRLVCGRASAAAAALAAAIYALNPSLLYLQSTAMTETIFLCAFVWSLTYFDEFLRGMSTDAPGEPAVLPAWRALERCGMCLAAGVFTRYDGWIYAFVIGGLALLAALAWRARHPEEREVGRLLRSMTSFLLLLALCPALWLAHNYCVNQHPMDWLNGPYSAKAIEQRTTRPGDPPYPGKNNMMVAAEHFLKAARMNTGEGAREHWMLLLATAGVLVTAFRVTRFAALLLAWLPLPFYAWSVAHGSVPIFVPEWWPYSYYNVRYGMELLPAIAVFAALLPWAVARLRLRWATVAAFLLVLAATLAAYNSSAAAAGKHRNDHEWSRSWMIPLSYREGWVNGHPRMQLERQVALALAVMPPRATLLMYSGEHPGALQMAAVPYVRVVSECTRYAWDAGLSAPYAVADYVVAFAGDPVDLAVKRNPRGLTKLSILHVSGQPEVTIYRSTRR